MEIVDGINYLDEIKTLIIEYVKELNRDLSFQNLECELINLKAKYSGNNGKILVALVNQKVVGCVGYYRHDQKRCDMKRLYVLPAYRKFKIGYNLVIKIIDLAKNEGYQEMVLDTIKPLKSAIKLYQRLGFKRIPAYYKNPMNDVIYMKLEL